MLEESEGIKVYKDNMYVFEILRQNNLLDKLKIQIQNYYDNKLNFLCTYIDNNKEVDYTDDKKDEMLKVFFKLNIQETITELFGYERCKFLYWIFISRIKDVNKEMKKIEDIYCNIGIDVCPICGLHVNGLCKSEVCKEDIYILSKCSEYIKDENYFIIKGEIYSLGDEDDLYKGFDGNKYTIKRLSDSKEFTTTNLRNVFSVPNRFRDIVKDNSIFVNPLKSDSFGGIKS